MSDAIKHECGIALIRLKKPLQFYIDKYGTAFYGLNKMYLLMEKQHNRGQDGAGLASIKIDMEPGHQYIFRQRSIQPSPIADIFKKINAKMQESLSHTEAKENANNAQWLKNNVDYLGEVYLGHLRYGTHSANTLDACHPMLRLNNWRTRNLVVAGNFNMTNVDELFLRLVELGQHPKEKRDTITVMEKIGHFLDQEVQANFEELKKQGYQNQEITPKIEEQISLLKVLQRSCRDFDGGYAMAGLTGFGAAFVARDPSGIRPAYYYQDEEIIVVASEKPAIKTAFNIEFNAIEEIPPGHALIIEKSGKHSIGQFIETRKKLSCSFERIYFSRGTDPDIYQERKKLGSLLCHQIIEAIEANPKEAVFSYIPNTAETAFLGMISAVEKYMMENAQALGLAGDIQAQKPRVEKLVIKDTKLRTFITDDAHRDDMVAYVYDTTYEVINKRVDTIVVIDDSIVRGTTLEKSILTMLGRLEPKSIVIVSSAPQIRYPDCYGIDMSKLKEFVAFRALLALLEERGLSHKLQETYIQAKQAIASGTATERNFVQDLYALFEYEEVSDKIAQIVRPKDFVPEVKVVYQTVENLHKAIPNHLGDWYFTGNYPTPGGNKVVNTAFVNFIEGKDGRAY